MSWFRRKPPRDKTPATPVGDMPGVELHAQALENIFDGQKLNTGILHARILIDACLRSLVFHRFRWLSKT